MCEGVTRGQPRPIDLKSSFIFIFIFINIWDITLLSAWRDIPLQPGDPRGS